jgi:peroxiredoxin family protein
VKDIFQHSYLTDRNKTRFEPAHKNTIPIKRLKDLFILKRSVKNINQLSYTIMSKKLSIISFSGDFDKLTAVFTLATGAAAVGYEVNLFFTFWGLNAIKKKQGRSFLGKSALTKMFGFFMGGLNVAPVSRLNFGGISPRIFRSLMKKNNVATLEELVDSAKILDVKFYACEMAMHILGLKKEDFVPEVKDVLGVATFLKLADDGQTLFI